MHKLLNRKTLFQNLKQLNFFILTCIEQQILQFTSSHIKKNISVNIQNIMHEYKKEHV